MKNVELNIAIEVLVRDYLELNSSYKVASKHNISATVVKRLLKGAGVLRTQSLAAKIRGIPDNFGTYERTDEHLKNLSNHASQKTGDKNPFFGKTHSNSTKTEIGKASKERTKERNGNYKHGKYVRRPRDFKISEFKPIRNFVFNRDKHTCYYCKHVGGHLHAHHILPYWVKVEAFLDADNIVTVCTDCHFSKAHLSNWQCFDVSLVTDVLLSKYLLDRERLNELALYSKAMR